jgi:YD repeat-containing protein
VIPQFPSHVKRTGDKCTVHLRDDTKFVYDGDEERAEVHLPDGRIVICHPSEFIQIGPHIVPNQYVFWLATHVGVLCTSARTKYKW